MTTEIDKAILAAFLATDGHLGIMHRVRHKNLQYHGAIIQVYNTDKRIPEFCLRFGGRIGVQRPRLPHYRPVYKWEAARKAEQVAILEQVKPFMVAKGEQVLVLLEFLATHDHAKRLELAQRVKALNTKGRNLSTDLPKTPT